MPLDKAIKHGKEKRRQYTEGTAKFHDRTCRNHGTCTYCQRNRTYAHRKALQRALAMAREDK